MNSADRMQCMEVWGGNRSTNRAFRTTGLDVWIQSKPHADSEQGGDVYYVSSCASGRITRLLLADVSGHGEAVSSQAETLRQLMRHNINFIDQSVLVAAINREFAARSTGGAFATALIATYYAPRNRLTLSNAGHPSPLIYRAAEQEWQELRAEGTQESPNYSFPLGIEAEELYAQFQIELQSEDLVLGFTDGVTESNNDDGSLLGLDGLRELVSRIPTRDPAAFLSQLNEALSDRCGLTSEDDRTMILFQRNNEPIALRDNLLAPFRFAADLADRTLLRFSRS